MRDTIQMVSSSIDAVTRSYQTTTHNLANVSTRGYKRQLTQFNSSLQAAMDLQGTAAQGSVRVTGKTIIDFSQGPLEHTQRPLDLALEGDGFLVIETPQGPLYTRAASLRVNEDRQLIDVQGRLVSGANGAITLPPATNASDVTVASDGSITVQRQPLGKLRIVAFEDKKGLVPGGDLCFRWTGEGEPEAATDCRVHQGYLEGSNVNSVQELVSLIAASRLYEANLKTVNAQDDKSKSLLSVAMG
jgi:flagellar basal body rod protein FlgG